MVVDDELMTMAHLPVKWVWDTVVVAVHLLPWPAIYAGDIGEAGLGEVAVADNHGVEHLLLYLVTDAGELSRAVRDTPSRHARVINPTADADHLRL